MAVKHVTLRAWSDNSDVPPQKINQGDILSRTFMITLIDASGAPIDLTISSVRVHFTKPNGHVCYIDASIINASAGIFSVTLDSQCTAVPGLVKTIVQVTSPDGENMYCTGPKISVGAINIEGSIISSNEFTALTDALAQVQNIANKADLNTDGKVIQDPASYGRANGGATLNTDGKVIQDPASYGQVGGAALISNLPQSPQLVMLHPDGTLSTAGGLPQSDDGTTSEHWVKHSDGTLECWGFVGYHALTISTAYGSVFWYNDYTHNLPSDMPAFADTPYVDVNTISGGLLFAFSENVQNGKTLHFSIMSPQKVSNLNFQFTYYIKGRWK